MISGYRILDTSILVYSLLEDHPASSECQKFIESQDKVITSLITLVEIFFVMTKIYGIDPTQTWEKIDELATTSPLEFTELEPDNLLSALNFCNQYRVDTNDGILIQICLESKNSILVTDDSNLTEVCRKLGISTQNPISEKVRQLMSRWEEDNLPNKGLPRILYRIWSWINKKDEKIATEFRGITQNLVRLP